MVLSKNPKVRAYFEELSIDKKIPSLNYAPHHEYIWRGATQLLAFFISALDGGEWFTS
jgi:hypothetical protein